jgi:hypothetical protein
LLAINDADHQRRASNGAAQRSPVADATARQRCRRRRMPPRMPLILSQFITELTSIDDVG